MARGRNSKRDNNSIIAVSMDELFANCETILDSPYMSILLDPSLFVFQNFSFIILFFLILYDKFSFYKCDRWIVAPVGGKTPTFLAS